MLWERAVSPSPWALLRRTPRQPGGKSAAGPPGGELRAVRRSLTRQSVAVAVVAALVDAVVFALSGIFSVAPGPASAVLVAIVAADLAFAAPPATAAVVAVVQVAIRLAVTVLLHRHGLPVRVADVGFLVAGYRAGAWLSGRASLVTVPVLVLGACGAPLIAGGAPAADWRLLLTSAISGGVVPWLVGRYTAGRGAYIAELEQRERLARQQQRTALERALTDEREAIARDLHDVISHHVSAIGIHAGAARLALHGSGAATVAATRSLSAVESESRAAMVDLRRQLDLLHGREDAARQPGMADIDDLVDRVRVAGLDLTVTTSGAELPRSLDITVYRIVQELLTNALRHGAGSARLTVRNDGTGVEIEQSNPLADEEDSNVPAPCVPPIRATGPLDSAATPHGPDAVPAGERVSVRATTPATVRFRSGRRAPLRERGPAARPGGAAPEAATGVHRGLDGIRRRAELFDGSVDHGVADGRWRVLVRLPGGRS
ncbi:sensor histidine kinase [Nocardia violaceofusca]|uniref:sensor histidine kinase n=1 Tax=Nocardia violaceofusca TaxID=941182 RepID=UPI001E327128|nr:histidine kinase [Nocardia violaceofusca]